MELGIDIDGVLLDLFTAFSEWHKRSYGQKTAHMTYAQICEYLGDERQSRFDAFNKDLPLLPVLPGAVEAVNALRKEHNVYIITSRPLLLQQKTYSDVAQLDIPPELVFFTSYQPKTTLCQNLGIDILVEDMLHYANDVAAQGTGVILYNHQGTNPHANGETHPSIQVAHDWNEVQALVTEYESQQYRRP